MNITFPAVTVWVSLPHLVRQIAASRHLPQQHAVGPHVAVAAVRVVLETLGGHPAVGQPTVAVCCRMRQRAESIVCISSNIIERQITFS